MELTITWPVILVGAATIFVAVILLKSLGSYKTHLPVPPGPRALPVIGHFHLLFDKTRPIHQILASLAKRYGPVMQVKFGSKPVLVISSAELARECFTVRDKALASKPTLSQGKHLGYNYSMVAWAPYGPYWRTARKVCVVELLSAKRIQSFAPKRMQQLRKGVNSMFQQAKLQSSVNMKRFFSTLNFKTLMSMIINEKYFGEESGVSEEIISKAIEESFVYHGCVNIGDYIPWLKWLDLQGYAKAMIKVQAEIDLFMQRILEKHREKVSKEGGEMEDFVDVLIQQADENAEAIPDKDEFIKATTGIMFSAGSDTLSVAMEWALSLLLQHPHAMRKVQEELDSKVGHNRLVEESDIPQLKYLQSIVRESLRLHPSAPLLSVHESIKDCTVGGYHIPAGTMLFVNAWAIHRDPRLWDKPLEFIPERFMEREIDVNNIQMKADDSEIIPFGAGRRGCPGAVLAMNMVQLTLATFLHSFEWFIPAGQVIDMNEGVGLTMPRVVPLEVAVKPRLSHHLY
ncbi:hypothetical protein SUGI_1115920 [Cryptomeria japonica]|uniref:cytochrome P450 81Q32 n=1 Tax=Cryptomeria japonica TaxID=3369 RepID=UPI002414B529|nr:cytochrome P450 81Q32 [Cryptomeria japonica]GLJ52463.1 hypothetical protein SUGI_1115920 [Cryptomeria japonica]